MTITFAALASNRQADDAAVGVLRFVKESVTAKFALRGIFTCITGFCLWPAGQTDRRKIKVLAVRADDDSVFAHLFDAIDAVLQAKVRNAAGRPIHCEKI